MEEIAFLKGKVNDLTVDLAWVENALRDIAGMVHQEHLTARVNGFPGEATLNRIDHAITRIVMETLERLRDRPRPDMDGSSNGVYGC